MCSLPRNNFMISGIFWHCSLALVLVWSFKILLFNKAIKCINGCTLLHFCAFLLKYVDNQCKETL